MDFQNRLKKELSEGIVKSLLKDAGYRVIDLGVESTLREVECLSVTDYFKLHISKGLRMLPDLWVMNKEQTIQYSVEVKYRSGWDVNLLKEMEDQVQQFEEIILIYVNGKAPETELDSPSRYIRCCRLKHHHGEYLFQSKNMGWQPVNQLRDDESQWWAMNLLQNLFPLFNENAGERTITRAVASIRSILN